MSEEEIQGLKATIKIFSLVGTSTELCDPAVLPDDNLYFRLFPPAPGTLVNVNNVKRTEKEWDNPRREAKRAHAVKSRRTSRLSLVKVRS